MAAERDRVGIGWRPELAVGIYSHLDRIDLVEVVADGLFKGPRRELEAIETLAAQVPVVLHGVSLGLASAIPVDPSRLEKMARVVGAVRPEHWSEHLAFVRGGGVEIGHLAAPPRTEATIEGTARNVARARRVVGSAPLLENVATLLEPPGSSLDEASWTARALSESGSPFLLDLNNHLANSVNSGRTPSRALSELPLERVSAVHIAGGRWITSSAGAWRLLDDHLHDVPDAVYELLTNVAERTDRPVTVILERDGAYPPFDELLAQVERAREALRAGRRRRVTSLVRSAPTKGEPGPSLEQAQRLEAFLAELYVDPEMRRRWLADPRGEAERAALDHELAEALARLDRVGLELAAKSISSKRAH